MIFIDSNIPMYLVGAAHPHKTDSQMCLERLVLKRERLVTDVEVFQELLHRYVAIARPDAIQPAWDTLRKIVDEVFPIDEELVTHAKSVVLSHPRLSARDALHVAVMQRHSIDTVLSFDRGFVQLPGITRIP